MCGVAGILHADPGRSAVERDLVPLRDALVHRGPDDSGVYCDGALGLVHTRLSILDLSERARQPMLSATGRFAVSFNGEIYNFRELRSGLQRQGRSFATQSDTEVILHLAEAGGVDALDALEGMFAFALFDRQRRELWLVRDRLGIKPMFWTTTRDGIAFASEPKALRPLASRSEFAPERIGEYLAFRHLADCESPEDGIHTLLPGQRLWTDGRSTRIERWWTPPLGRDADPSAIDDVIDRCVQRQLVSDVAVGTFLSGGLDSALVTAHAAAHLPNLDTFTVGFSEEGWDETPRALGIANSVGAKAHQVRLDPADYVASLGRAIWHLDAPLNHAHSPHLLALARFARQYVTVALTGEGSDELFAGYPRYRLFLLGRHLRHLPEAWRAGLARRFRPKAARVARLFDAATRSSALAASMNAAFIPLDEAARLAGVESPEAIIAPRRVIAEEAASADRSPLQALLELDRRTYLVSLLQRMDRMTMAAGLEARVPLLDEAILDLALRMDPSQMLDGCTAKKPVRSAAEQRFGAAHARAPKSGFGVPLDRWLRAGGPLDPVMRALLEDPRTRQRGWLDIDLVRRRFEAHRRAESDATEMLWGALNLELFARVCLEGGDPAEVAA